MSEPRFDAELAELKRRSVDRLMAAEVFDEQAFKALLAYLDAEAERIRSDFVISKQVLSCLGEAANAIRSRAEYLPAVRPFLKVASECDMILDLMIIGETRSDRQSPRVF